MFSQTTIHKISVVVPVLNERESISELHKRLTVILEKLGTPFEIIVVDDGSEDGTFGALRSCGRVRAFRFSRNFGKTAALECGISHATGDVVITMDGDLENLPEDIPLFVEKAKEGYGVVSGWRQNRWGRQRLTRRIPSEIANWLISKTTGVRLHDHGCMFKLFRKNALRSMVFLGDTHRFIAAYAAMNGARVSEIPISFTPRKYGTSKFGVSRTFGVLLDIVAFHFFRKYASRPMHFFGRVGFASLFLSGAVFLWALYLRVFMDTHFSRTPLPVLVAIFIVVGVILILLGLMAEMILRLSYNGGTRYEIVEEHHGK